MRFNLRIRLLVLAGLCVLSATAQMQKPVKWKFSNKKLNDCEYELQFTGTIDEHWHVYSLNQKGEDGPNPSQLLFNKAKEYELIGKPTEGVPIKAYDKVFEMDVLYFEKAVVFKQKIRLLTDKPITIAGNFEYQACTEVTCIFETDNPFEFQLTGTAACVASVSSATPTVVGDKPTEANTSACICDSNAIVQAWSNKSNKQETVSNGSSSTNTSSSAAPADGKKSAEPVDNNFWSLFIKGFLGGLAALLTPCVFPMIPLTVSFFTKRSKNRAKGITNAILYGISIIIIYVTLGLGVSFIFGSDALNSLSTNVWFNLFFFVMLIVFAASFLGAFEIVLPSRFVNKIDAQSDRGGLIGIFFMAMTLSLVSFSCTGPVIGPLLVDAAVNGGVKGPFFGMFGFSTALAFPFALFALFPGWLNSLPKSGGWLNSVKVTLGFLELAFAFKFASNADLVIQAGILTREVFIALWIIIFGLLGMYLMGWFKLSHDSDVKFIAVPRLFFAVIVLSFTIYLIPGMWGAPLKLISGFPPPDFYSESPLGFGGSAMQTSSEEKTAGPEKRAHCPNQLPCFQDYDEALAYAKKVNKPLMIDFTGWACVNCRKMESQIWTNPEVDKRIRNEVVLVSLHVDDKRDLPEDQKTVKKLGDRDFKIKTIGNKWSYFQANIYKTNTQPQYILLDGNEKMLTRETAHYDPDPSLYIKWLDEGINAYKNQNKK